MIVTWVSVLACAIDHGNIFVVKDIQQYIVPTSKKIKGLEDSIFSLSKKLVIHKLVSPQTADEILIEAKCVSGEKCGDKFMFRLKKGGHFSLPYGRYKLLCPNYELTYEEMASEQNRQRSLPGAELPVPPSNWMPRKERPIKLYIYPKDSLVDIRGRLVNQEGKGVSNVSIRGAPYVNDPNNIAWYPDVEITTDATGQFEFKNIPPASLDLAARFLLFGRIMKPSYNSERIFDFSWRILGFSSKFETNHLRFKTPLISDRNLRDLLPFADKLRMLNDRMGEDKLGFVDVSGILKKLPDSTNNVIYVGDIVLPEKRMLKSD